MNLIKVFLILNLLLSSGAAMADLDEMYKSKNCFACHRLDRNVVGPSFKNVAAKYVGETGADVKLAEKIREGGVGNWGATPMPPQNQVSNDEALMLARWILELK